uniref:Transthyretin-like protein 46 n=1 Tax=Plectus sambesii TaxID=2011161 RepID=A0A914W9J1_9BILA
MKGKLTCDGKPAVGVVVKLQDHDTFDPNDTLGCNKTTEDGSYEVQGFTDEKSLIDLRLKIYTDCHDSSLWGLIKNTPCQRRITFEIPKEAINDGQTVTKWFDVGETNLDMKQPSESRACAIFERC